MTDFPRGTGQPAAKRLRLSRGGQRFTRVLSRAGLLRAGAERPESGEISSHARTQFRHMASTITMNAVFDRRPPRPGAGGDANQA
jgi:hypothetical protein